jgi:choline dehydrogenase-like flavoprotein
LDFEQTRLFNNSIQLSNELDSFGNKKANINWEILKKDYLKFQKIGENFVDKWNKDFIDSPINKVTPENKNIKPYDVFHPVGTCMISSNENAIIDLDFKVRITENLFVINSGVIPSASIANPTFSLFFFFRISCQETFL